MIDQLRATCRQLLEEGTVRVVIGYGENSRGDSAHPVFVTDPSHVEQLTFNRHCHHNLVAYLKRPEIKALGAAAIVVKACDERALVGTRAGVADRAETDRRDWRGLQRRGCSAGGQM